MNSWNRVFIYETQPVTAEGGRAILGSFRPELEAVWAMTLPDTPSGGPGTVFLIDKALNTTVIADWCRAGRAAGAPVVVWGGVFSDVDTLRLLQAGVRGLLSKSATGLTLMECLTAVADGRSWI